MVIGEGFRPEYRPSINIEGEPISPFREITIDEADPVDLRDITWTRNQAGISFEQVGTYRKKRFGNSEQYNLYMASSQHLDPDGQSRQTDLTNISSKKRILFTGSRNGFFMHDPAWVGVDADFYVVGVNPFELEEDIKQHAGTYHEIGHVLIVDCGFDAALLRAAVELERKHLPAVAMSLAYGIDLATSISEQSRTNMKGKQLDSRALIELMVDEPRVDDSLRLFHERNAWAAGMRLQRQHNFPTGFEEKRSVAKYARCFLETYVASYADRRFVEGVNLPNSGK